MQFILRWIFNGFVSNATTRQCNRKIWRFLNLLWAEKFSDLSMPYSIYILLPSSNLWQLFGKTYNFEVIL